MVQLIILLFDNKKIIFNLIYILTKSKFIFWIILKLHLIWYIFKKYLIKFNKYCPYKVFIGSPIDSWTGGSAPLIKTTYFIV